MVFVVKQMSNLQQIMHFGHYLGWYYGRDHKAKIVIGKDTRRSSYDARVPLRGRTYRIRQMLTPASCA